MKNTILLLVLGVVALATGCKKSNNSDRFAGIYRGPYDCYFNCQYPYNSSVEVEVRALSGNTYNISGAYWGVSDFVTLDGTQTTVTGGNWTFRHDTLWYSSSNVSIIGPGGLGGTTGCVQSFVGKKE